MLGLCVFTDILIWLFYQLLKGGIKISNHVVPVSIYFEALLLDSHTLMLMSSYRTFYHYEVSHFISGTILCLDVYSV